MDPFDLCKHWRCCNLFICLFSEIGIGLCISKLPQLMFVFPVFLCPLACLAVGKPMAAEGPKGPTVKAWESFKELLNPVLLNAPNASLRSSNSGEFLPPFGREAFHCVYISNEPFQGRSASGFAGKWHMLHKGNAFHINCTSSSSGSCLRRFSLFWQRLLFFLFFKERFVEL